MDKVGVDSTLRKLIEEELDRGPNKDHMNDINLDIPFDLFDELLDEINITDVVETSNDEVNMPEELTDAIKEITTEMYIDNGRALTKIQEVGKKKFRGTVVPSNFCHRYGKIEKSNKFSVAIQNESTIPKKLMNAIKELNADTKIRTKLSSALNRIMSEKQLPNKRKTVLNGLNIASDKIRGAKTFGAHCKNYDMRNVVPRRFGKKIHVTSDKARLVKYKKDINRTYKLFNYKDCDLLNKLNFDIKADVRLPNKLKAMKEITTNKITFANKLTIKLNDIKTERDDIDIEIKDEPIGYDEETDDSDHQKSLSDDVEMIIPDELSDEINEMADEMNLRHESEVCTFSDNIPDDLKDILDEDLHEDLTDDLYEIIPIYMDNMPDFSTIDFENLKRPGTKPQVFYNANTKMYYCTLCPMTTANRSVLTVHVRKHSDEKPFTCDLCSFRTNYKSSLTLHMKRHMSGNMLKCPECEFTAISRVLLGEHKRKLHELNKSLKCRLCFFTTTSKIDLRDHEAKHDNFVPYICKHCNQGYKSRSSFIYHIKKHTEGKQYLCEFCNFASDTKSDLVKHKKMHITGKRFMCAYCDFMTADNSNLRRHERSHSSLKPFRCSDCEYTTGDSKCLLKHQNGHKIIKQYQCQHCTFSTNDRNYWLKHTRRTHGVSALNTQ